MTTDDTELLNRILESGHFSTPSVLTQTVDQKGLVPLAHELGVSPDDLRRLYVWIASSDFQQKALLERVASLEATVASSWACRTRDQYEKDFRGSVKGEITSFAFKVTIGAAIFLAGTGALFIRSAVQDVFQNRQAEFEKSLRTTYDSITEDDRRRFEWSRFHNYGMNYVYIAELYSEASIPTEAKRVSIQKALRRAEGYFRAALSIDGNQASTYYELGRLYSDHPRTLGLPGLANDTKAIAAFEDAVPHYSVLEVEKGWRADAYRIIGALYFDEHVRKVGDSNSACKQAAKYLSAALEDYLRVDRRLTDDRYEGNVVETRRLLAACDACNTDGR